MTRKDYEQRKAEYLKNYPFQVVKVCTKQNDQYTSSICCGDQLECANRLANAKTIYNGDKYISFRIIANTFPPYEELKRR